MASTIDRVKDYEEQAQLYVKKAEGEEKEIVTKTIEVYEKGLADLKEKLELENEERIKKQEKELEKIEEEETENLNREKEQVRSDVKKNLNKIDARIKSALEMIIDGNS